MREKAVYILSAAAALLLVRNLYAMFMVLPDDALQGAIYRIMFFHIPAAMTAMFGFLIAAIASVLYLSTKRLAYDSFAAAVIEVSLALATINIVTGSIWGRISWGIWWTWDARLTSMFVCWLLYAGYLMLRRAVPEAAQRARFSAVLSIFAFSDVVIVWKSIEWWRTQHPGPVLTLRTGGGKMDPAMEAVLYWNLLAILLVAIVLVIVRMRQEDTQREIASLRQLAHSM